MQTNFTKRRRKGREGEGEEKGGREGRKEKKEG
jgi:hypothetical protein